jgi:hypothetical protein
LPTAFRAKVRASTVLENDRDIGDNRVKDNLIP